MRSFFFYVFALVFGLTSLSFSAYADNHDIVDCGDSCPSSEQTNSGASNGGQKATTSKREVKIDLYAPFSATGKDIFCKTSRSNCDGAKTGDGCFDYSPGPCAEGSPGVTVQRITATGSDEIAQGYVALVFKYGLGLGIAASVLMIVVGGFTIMIAFGDTQARENGMKRVQQGAIGIALLILSAAILRTINPYYFKIGAVEPKYKQEQSELV